jgi:hypothetical protein
LPVAHVGPHPRTSRLNRTRALLPHHHAHHARPCRRATSCHLHAPAMPRHLHVRRTPSSPPLSTASFTPKAYPFHSIHFVLPPPSAPRARELSRRRPSCTTAPPRAATPRTPPQLSSPWPTPLVVEAGTPKKCHRSRAATAESLHDVSPHRSSSGHTYSTPSTARTPDTFLPQHSTANDRRSSPPRRSPPADRPPSPPPSSNRHGDPSAAFCLKAEPPSPGPLPGYFPTDQRRPADQISLASRRRRGGGGFPSPVPSAGPDCRVSWAVSAKQAEFGCGLSPSAQYNLSISFRFILI